MPYNHRGNQFLQFQLLLNLTGEFLGPPLWRTLVDVAGPLGTGLAGMAKGRGLEGSRDLLPVKLQPGCGQPCPREPILLTPRTWPSPLLRQKGSWSQFAIVERRTAVGGPKRFGRELLQRCKTGSRDWIAPSLPDRYAETTGLFIAAQCMLYSISEPAAEALAAGIGFRCRVSADITSCIPARFCPMKNPRPCRSGDNARGLWVRHTARGPCECFWPARGSNIPRI